jgi:Helicase associated domain
LEALDALDFEWTPRDAKWNSCFRALLEFRDDNGHLSVPTQGRLDKWAAHQRRLRKAQKAGKTQIPNGNALNVSVLTRERIEKLESIEEWKW